MSRTRTKSDAQLRASFNRELMKRRANQQLGPVTKKKARRAPRDPASFKTSSTFQPEMKSLDSWIFNQPIVSGTGAANHVLLLNSPILGTERYNRIGRRIQVKSVHVHWTLHPVQPVPTSVPEDLVFFLVWDLEAGATPALTSLLQTVDGAGVTNSSVTSQINLDNSKRYIILKRKNVPLRVCGTATGALPCNGAAFQAMSNDLDFKWNVKVNRTTQFNAGNTGVIGDITNGALLVCWWTSLGAGLPTSFLDVSARCRYYD